MAGNRQKQWKTAFIVLLLLKIVFYVVGAILISLAANCASTYAFNSDGDYVPTNNCRVDGEFYAGCSFIGLGVLLSLGWIVLIFMRFSSWYRKGLSQQPVYQQPSQYANPGMVPSQYGSGTPQQEKVYSNVTQVPSSMPQQAPARYP